MDTTQSRVEAMLSSLRLNDLIELAMPRAESIHEIFDIIRPLLTRTIRISWTDLVTVGSSWRESVDTLDVLTRHLNDCQAWTIDNIESIVEFALREVSPPRLSPSELLYRCALFSEFRLPLAASLWHLGKAECLARLVYASSNLTQMNLVS